MSVSRSRLLALALVLCMSASPTAGATRPASAGKDHRNEHCSARGGHHRATCKCRSLKRRGAGSRAKRCDRPPRLFAADSVWNARLPVHAPLDPTSPIRTAAFTAEIRREIDAGTGPWISEDSYSTPIYTVGPGQPTMPVRLDTGSWGASLQAAFEQGVPIPPDATPAAGTDGHLTVYQPSTDRLWEFWQASKQADGWHASWGGAMDDVSRSPGYYSDASLSGLAPSDGWSWGSTASSLPVAAGTITIAELRSGRIDHALALNIPAPCKDIFSWPAQRTDGTSAKPDCLPEGAHLRIDPRLDIARLDLPPISRMIAEAGQKYGLIVRDKTGHATGLYAEDPTRTGGDPYRGPSGFYGGLKPWDFMPQIPWNRMQLLRMSTCTKAPCSEPAP